MSNKNQDLYVKEMLIWLKQNKNRITSCDIVIDKIKAEIKSHNIMIIILRKAIRLELDQKKCIRQRLARAERELKSYLGKKNK